MDCEVVYDNGMVVVTVYTDRVRIAVPALGDSVFLTLDELNGLTDAVNEVVGSAAESLPLPPKPSCWNLFDQGGGWEEGSAGEGMGQG